MNTLRYRIIVMQVSFQTINGALRRAAVFAAVALFGPQFMAELSAEPASSGWIAGKKSAARLIAAPDAAQGSYRAGVQIRLDADALTFWRSPGEAGAPPVFNFRGSENVKEVAVHYPAPQRIDDGGVDAFGYRHFVTFPVDVKLADKSRPGVLSLSLDYAVCSKICLPVRANARLELPPWAPPAASSAGGGAEDGPAEPSFDAARAEVPRRLDAAERDSKVAIRREPDATRPTWRVKIHHAEPEADAGPPSAAARTEPDLFVEAQQGWYFESKKGEAPDEFLVVQIEGPSEEASVGMIPVTLTLAQPRHSYEFAVDLKAAPVGP